MIKVSDHALVRFLERTGAAEIEPLRQALTASLTRAATAAAVLGEHRFTVVSDGLRYVVRGGVLVSVLPEKRGRSR
jgi:hypothetical protein